MTRTFIVMKEPDKHLKGYKIEFEHFKVEQDFDSKDNIFRLDLQRPIGAVVRYT